MRPLQQQLEVLRRAGNPPRPAAGVHRAPRQRRAARSSREREGGEKATKAHANPHEAASVTARSPGLHIARLQRRDTPSRLRARHARTISRPAALRARAGEARSVTRAPSTARSARTATSGGPRRPRPSRRRLQQPARGAASPHGRSSRTSRAPTAARSACTATPGGPRRPRPTTATACTRTRTHTTAARAGAAL